VKEYAIRAGRNWIDEFRREYHAWFVDARPLIEAHQYPAAFRHYPFPAFTETPWTPITRPMAEVRLGVVTTAGLYRKGVDAPFSDTVEGDPQIIELPSAMDPAQLDIAHRHLPDDFIRSDMNMVLPLEHLRALVHEGRLGEVAPRLFSVVGYRTRAHDVAEQTATAIAAAMAEDGVTFGLIVPV
jgi:D-proline reductase (dithiol) PrdB